MGEYLMRASDVAVVSAFATIAIAAARGIEVSAIILIAVY